MFSKARHIFHCMAVHALDKAGSAAAFLQKTMLPEIKNNGGLNSFDEAPVAAIIRVFDGTPSCLQHKKATPETGVAFLLLQAIE